MSLLVQCSLCPWKRTTARSLVASRTGGLDDLWPCGMSTLTNGSSCLRRKSSVSAWLSPANQLSWRSSTAMRSGLHRLATSSRYCLLPRRMVNHGGNWNSSTPSFPAATRGSSADRNRVHTSSYACGGRSSGYTFFLSVSGRRSLYIAETFVGCPVRRLNALTLNVKSAGLRSAHSCAVDSAGGEEYVASTSTSGNLRA